MKILKSAVSSLAVLSLIVGGFFINSNTALAAAPITIIGVTAPVTGATPVMYTFVPYYDSVLNNVPLEANITWSPSPVNGIFASGTAYTASIKVNVQSSNTGIVPVGANTVTVSGATTVNNTAGTIENQLVWNGGPTWNIKSVDVVAVFPATAAPALAAPIQLTIVAPSMNQNKPFDGTTVGTVNQIGVLSGVVAGDNVTITAVATYDTAAI